MRLIAFAAVSTLALMAAAGCAPRIDYAHKTTLDCPDRQGELRRTAVAPDRKSCTYTAPEGTDVTLQLAAVNGDAGAVLSALETSLVGPAAPGQPAKADAADKAAAGASDKTEDKDKAKDKAKDADDSAPLSVSATATTSGQPGDAARAAQQASADAVGGKDDWSTDSDHKSGVRLHDGHGSGADSAHISLPGLHIDADESTGNARVDIAGVHIDANDENATVHVVREVRLRGQGFSRERNGLRATFIAKRQNLPDGYRFVGYQAAGPKTGPLTIAIVKSRDEINDGNRLYRDIRRLVRLNGGA